MKRSIVYPVPLTVQSTAGASDQGSQVLIKLTFANHRN